MTSGRVMSGAVRGGTPADGDASVPPPAVRAGRPPWWLLLVAFAVTVAVTADLLSRGVLERLDLQVSEVVSSWDLRDSPAYWPVWVVTQVGGRGTILIVFAGLVAWLCVRGRTLLPLVRVLTALVLLTVVVYAFKFSTGRTAPAYPGSFFHRDGASYPSGHVANAVLMWGVARWQAAEYALPPRVQTLLWWLAVVGPVATGIAMVSLDFHWVTDAVVGAAVGLLLLGVVHALDASVLSRWASARAGRPPA